MFPSVKKKTKRLFVPFVLIMLTLITIPVLAQTDGVFWNVIMQIPSPSGSNSWFPDLAVDHEGNVHVVWSETGDLGYPTRGGEGVFYSLWNGKQWLQYVDVIPPQIDIIRTSIVIDDRDQINLVFDYAPPFSLFYKQSPVDKAHLLNEWTQPVMVNERSNTYYSDIVAFKDYLHIVYDDGQFSNPQCDGCADIYYRNSPDDGRTWSNPIALYNTPTGSSRAQIDVDQNGTLYVSWDEGWDRLTGLGDPEYGVYMYSTDNGDTWSEPLKVEYPNSTNSQLTVGADGKGGVMLVWRTNDVNYPGVYFMWSQDYGKTWSSPQTISNFFGKSGSNPFDVYAMASDSDGHIHLLAAGYLSTSYQGGLEDNVVPPGLYHFEWDGKVWKKPTLLYKGSWYPEYPRLVIHNGNQLNAVWFLREKMIDAKEYHEVWYASGVSDAPFVEDKAIETEAQDSETTLSIDETDELAKAITETPTFSLQETTSNLDPFSEIDDYLVLLISMIPVSLLGVFAIIRSKIKG